MGATYMQIAEEHTSKEGLSAQRQECNIIHILFTVTSESLVSREFSRFFLKFHLSISISRYSNFTFTSRKEWNKKSFHFSFLEKNERKYFFTFHFSKKVKAYQISLFFSRKKSEIVHVTFNFSMKKIKIWIIYNTKMQHLEWSFSVWELFLWT